MTFLLKPRTVKEVAVRIGRKTCIATGHLRATRAENLVVRLSWGVWVRRDQCMDAPDPQTIRRNNPAQEFLLQHVQEPRTIGDLQRITGQERSKVQSALSKMVKGAVIERRDGNVFAAAHS